MLAEHQREAMVRARSLLAAHGCALLADEVGLGKSYVAGALVRWWVATNQGTADLVVPAALVPQWRETLARFEAVARIVTHDSIPPADGYGARRLVVVDEAHAFRNPRTRRYAALAAFTADACLLLVTATPVCNSRADLHALLRLAAADDVLARHAVPSIDAAFESRDAEAVRAIVAALVIRRGREVLSPALAFGSLERRVVRHHVPAVPALDLLRFPLVRDAGLLRQFLQRRLESSDAALLQSLRRQRRFYVRALSALAAGRELPKRDYRRAFAHEEDREMFQEVLFWELFAPPASGADPRAMHAEIERLDAAMQEVRALPPVKLSLLMDLVRKAGEGVLVFTGSEATARQLHACLSRTARCGLVTSRERSRERVLADFRTGRLDLVISTDMSAEGLNLQRAGTVVHYDIPWNPVKLDQRNGRAWRIGQTRPEVKAIYFLPDSRETRIVETVARKNRMRRRTLDGGPVGPPCAAPTLRPRLATDAAFLRLEAVAGEPLPEVLARRHKVGIEQRMAALAARFDPGQVEALARLASPQVPAGSSKGTASMDPAASCRRQEADDAR